MKNLKTALITFVCLSLPFLSRGQVIQSSAAITLPTTYNGQSVSTIGAGQTLTVTSGTSIFAGPGFTATAGCTLNFNISGSGPGSSPTLAQAPPANNNTNPELNWLQSTGFDENGHIVAQSKNFFDNNGQQLQFQVLNLSTGHVLASQTLNDLYGNPAINTLTAPIYSSDFIYRPNFISNTSQQKYNTSNFDGTAKLNNPDPVDNTQPGTVGWYYSNNNSYEPFVAATSYPYSRTDYFQDGTNVAARSAGIGEELKMGKGRENVANTFPVLQELTNYLAIRNKFFTDATIGQTGQTDLSGSSTMSMAKDQQGNWAMTIADKDGKALMSALPGNWLTVNNTITLNNYKEQFEINGATTSIFANGSPATASGFDKVRITGAGNFIVYYNNAIVYQGPLSGYSVPTFINTSSDYRFLSDQPFTVGYGGYASINATETTVYTTVCENCHSGIGAGGVLGQDYHYFCLPQAGNLNISGGTVKIVDLVSNNTLYDNQGSQVTLPAGMYKAIAETNQPQLQYNTGWGNITYSYYDQKGELVATIAPNGTQQLISQGLTNYTTEAQLPFTSTAEYDKQGNILAATSADGGRSELIYRKDGNLRFSQNAEQRKTGIFSYINYDADSRIIESGEYMPGDVTFSAAKANSALLESTSADGGLTNGTKQNWVRNHYDLPDNSHGQTGYIQDFLDGVISWTENPNSKTWYSYDSKGQISWIIRYQPTIGYKTIDYTYNYLGKVKVVAYQKNTTGESFYHYYDYDADMRLVNVQTSTDGITKLQQAKYFYYLHGPLKREELGDQLQGIDFTYTAKGVLKAINHPSGQAASDPGQDGIANSFAPDAFGMQLEYFNNDYSRANSNISSIATNTGQTYYNGNVSGISWQSKKPQSVVDVSGTTIQNPSMYTYTYDNKYQLTNATWGTPVLSASVAQNFTGGTQFNEGGLAYDPNGNILSLHRTDINSIVTDNFTYNYSMGNNQLQSVPGYASYTYDGLGRLASEIQADASKPLYYMQYDVAGKITGVFKDNAFTQPLVTYLYDDDGNRIQSTTYPASGTGAPTITNYVFDGTGNPLAIYTNNTEAELPIYGTDRLGTYSTTANNYEYEIRDNVGSVRVVINRNKNSNGQADIEQFNDYFPYGSIAQSGGAGYRYDYQGAYAEKDQATGFNNFKMRMYDGRIGRWLTTDTNGQFSSSYEGMGNDPVNGSDPTGGYETVADAAVAWLGAFFSGENPGDIYDSGTTQSDWGFNIDSKDPGVKAMFGDIPPNVGVTMTTTTDVQSFTFDNNFVNYTTTNYTGKISGKKGLFLTINGNKNDHGKNGTTSGLDVSNGTTGISIDGALDGGSLTLSHDKSTYSLGFNKEGQIVYNSYEEGDRQALNGSITVIDIKVKNIAQMTLNTVTSAVNSLYQTVNKAVWTVFPGNGPFSSPGPVGSPIVSPVLNPMLNSVLH